MPWVLQSLLTLLAESYCRLIWEKEEMWEQREMPAELRVLRLYLVASEEIRKSETERRPGVEWGLTNTQTKVTERVLTHHPVHVGKLRPIFMGA